MWNYFRIQLPVESARSQLSCETDLNISPTHQVLMRVSLYQEFYQCAVKFESGLISVIYGHKQKCHNITNIQWNTNTVTWPGENSSWQAVISTPLPKKTTNWELIIDFLQSSEDRAVPCWCSPWNMPSTPNLSQLPGLKLILEPARWTNTSSSKNLLALKETPWTSCGTARLPACGSI